MKAARQQGNRRAKRWIRRLAWLGLSLMALCFAWLLSMGLYVRFVASPATVLNMVEERTVPESIMMDPVYIAGPRTVPELERRVAEGKSNFRGYYMIALVEFDRPTSVPVLFGVACNPNEEPRLRMDAASCLRSMSTPAFTRLVATHPEFSSEKITWKKGDKEINFASWIQLWD